MKDGAVIEFDGRLDLATVAGTRSVSDELRAGGAVVVYLAIPGAKQRSPNVGGAEATNRFVPHTREVFDFCTGDNDQPVEFMSYNARLMVSTQPLTGFDLLPLCRLKLSDAGDRTPLIDKTFLPPALNVHATPELLQLLRRLNDQVASHFETWSEELKNRGVSFNNFLPENFPGMMLLALLGEMQGWLRCQLDSQGCHPFQLFQTMCQWLGRLAVINPLPGGFLPNYPAYDHDRLENCLGWLSEELERRLFRPADSNVKQVFFKGHQGIMKASVNPQWFDKRNWSLYLGINLREMPSTDREYFIKDIFFGGMDKLYWKIGSQDRMERLFRDVARGVSLSNIEKEKTNLPKRPIWLFAEFNDDLFWEEVRQTYTLSFRVDEDRIHNLNELEGSESIVVAVDRKLYKFQIAVFAVKK
jgi:type VI secretion system protein ImpJ